MEEMMPFLERIARGITELFGYNCEVAIHDLTRDYDETLVFILNGHVTGRKVGDGVSEKVLRLLMDDTDKQEDEYNYNFYSRTISGRIVKSSSIYIKDENSKVVGMISINYDITDLSLAQRAINLLLSPNKPNKNEKIGTITTNVKDLLVELIDQADRYVGVPVKFMTKQDKIRAIKYLNDSGAFLIKKSGDKVSNHYDISKFTLYNYLNENKED